MHFDSKEYSLFISKNTKHSLKNSTSFKDSFSCECVGGFEGALCDTAIDHCNDNPCRNGGQCTSKENDFECLCALGYSG